jgi:hypothetical protein
MPIWKRNLFVCWFGLFVAGIGMSQIAPVLPLYIQHLGVHNTSSIAQLSGIAFGVTYIISAIFSPIWGHFADKFGRKPMILRASLGMALIIGCMGFAPNVYVLIGLRLLEGAITGFSTACTALIATQTDKDHAGYALGTLSTRKYCRVFARSNYWRFHRREPWFSTGIFHNRCLADDFIYSIKWFGQSCFTIISDNGSRIVIDPFDKKIGYPLPNLEADIVTTSHNRSDHNNVSIVRGKFKHLDKPGQYLESGIVISGISTFHDNKGGAFRGKNIDAIKELYSL